MLRAWALILPRVLGLLQRCRAQEYSTPLLLEGVLEYILYAPRGHNICGAVVVARARMGEPASFRNTLEGLEARDVVVAGGLHDALVGALQAHGGVVQSVEAGQALLHR